jgi:hypothetical protein
MASRMPEMNWSHDPLVDSFKAFKARMNLFLEDNKITDPGKQATKIKIAIGDEGMHRLLSSGLSEADQKDPEKIWNLFENQVDATIKINFRIHRLEFAQLKQKSNENVGNFVSRLRQKAVKCEFSADELNDNLIKMLILSTPNNDFRKDLLSKPKDYKITDAIETGKEYEAIDASRISLKNLQC